MCDNAAYNYSYALKFALIAISLKQCVKKMSIFMTLQYNLFLIAIKLKMCDKVICEDHFMLVNDPDRYKTQGRSDKVVDDCLAALRFIPDSFVTSKMLF